MAYTRDSVLLSMDIELGLVTDVFHFHYFNTIAVEEVFANF